MLALLFGYVDNQKDSVMRDGLVVLGLRREVVVQNLGVVKSTVDFCFYNEVLPRRCD
jgi:hypothetical protein